MPSSRMSELSLLSRVWQKSHFEAVRAAFDPKRKSHRAPADGSGSRVEIDQSRTEYEFTAMSESGRTGVTSPTYVYLLSSYLGFFRRLWVR